MSLPLTQSPHSPPKSQEFVQDTEPVDLNEKRSAWLASFLSQNPHLFELHEQILHWTGDLSFAKVMQVDSNTPTTHINKKSIIELIYQHLHSIGLDYAAETLRMESGLDLQRLDQPWDRTDLLMLSSLGILPKEDPWRVGTQSNCIFIDQVPDPDAFSPKYAEDQTEIFNELLDESIGIVFKDDTQAFSSIQRASLRRFGVICATGSPEFVNSKQIHSFLNALPVITSSMHFFELLMAIYHCDELTKASPEQNAQLTKGKQVYQEGVVNFLTAWLKYNGKHLGVNTLKALHQFFLEIDEGTEDTTRNQIVQQIQDIQEKKSPPNPVPPTANPIIPDPQILFRPNLRFIDGDPAEVARQMSLLFYQKFKDIHPREFITALMERSITHRTQKLKDFVDFGQQIVLLIKETIAYSPVTDLEKNVQRIMDIANELVKLRNFHAAACFKEAITSEDFSLATFKCQKADGSGLWEKCGDTEKSLDVYMNAIERNYKNKIPTIPNIRAEIMAFQSKNRSVFAEGMIDWESLEGFANRVTMFHSFQNRPYNFWPVPQLQAAITKAPAHNNLQIADMFDQLIRIQKI